MKRTILITILILGASVCFSQTKFESHIQSIGGVWIEKSFKNYFDSIPSIMEYSKSLLPSGGDIPIYPIGLRIQSVEQKNGTLNIGYGSLHSHVLHPEVSRKCVQKKDTIYEQGSFSINLNQADSLGYYRIPDLMGIYAIGAPCFLRINYGQDTTITIIRAATEQIKEIKIEFIRISNRFTESYPFPNPRDFYVRDMTLVGSYVLKDSTGKVISSNFTINPNGSFEGIQHWKNQKIDFVTDVFCGRPAVFDKVIVYDPENVNNSDIEFFIYKKDQQDIIQFLRYKVDNGELLIDKPIFTLIKKN